jgi:hypothetical protein
MTEGPRSGGADTTTEAWDKYMAAVAEMEVARRNAAAAVASQEAAARAARAELASVRQRIALQRARIVDVASRAGRTAPELAPLPADQTTAALLIPVSVMDPTPGVTAALRGAVATLDAADTALTDAADAPAGGGLLAGWAPTARNAIPYGWYALLALVALVFINAYAGNSPSAQFVAFGFDLAVPFGAFLLGVVSIGLLFARGRDGRKPRSIALGVLICAVPLVAGLALTVL